MKQPTTQFIWFLLPHRSLPKHGRRHPNFDIISVMARKQARNYITEIIIKTSYKLVTLSAIPYKIWLKRGTADNTGYLVRKFYSKSNPPMIIYLIRHGESTSDVKKRYDGDYDDHLTENGKADAVKIADKLSNKKIQIIFFSSRIRAKETADIIGNRLKCDKVVIRSMDEQNIYGAYAELGINHPEEEYRKLGELLVNRDNAVEGAETYEHFKNRIISCFSEITNLSYHTIAIIMHGGPIRCIFREVLKLGEFKEIGNGSIIELEKNDLNFKIVKMSGAVLEGI